MRYHYKHRNNLPKRPGVYQLEELHRGSWRTAYAGMSVNIHQRWTAEGEREHKHLRLWRRHSDSMRLRVKPCWKVTRRYREAVLIQELKPRLNRQFPIPARCWNLAVWAEDLSHWIIPVAIAAGALMLVFEAI